MATTRADPDANSPSRQVLSELPGRVVTFLSAVGRDGATELAAWWSTNSKRLETAVARLHPEHTDLFAGIEAHDEPSSILAVAALLARIEQKQRAGARRFSPRCRAAGSTRQSALGSERWSRQHKKPARSPPPHVRVSRRKELTALYYWYYYWYRDWATTARSALGRKSLQIALGLATRARRGVMGSAADDRPKGAEREP